MRTAIIVKFDLEGFHCWPDAPDGYELLRTRHGHIFHFECHVPVVELNRSQEFLELRRELLLAVQRSYGLEPCDFRHNSCEMLAHSLARTILNVSGVAPTRVAVYEDQFVGAEAINE